MWGAIIGDIVGSRFETVNCFACAKGFYPEIGSGSYRLAGAGTI